MNHRTISTYLSPYALNLCQSDLLLTYALYLRIYIMPCANLSRDVAKLESSYIVVE